MRTGRSVPIGSRVWLASSSLYLAFLSFTDLWLFLYLAVELGADPLTLGVASSAWSLVFIVSNLLSGRIVEAGLNRPAALASSILLCLAVLTVWGSTSVAYAVVAYSVLHAASVALGQTATSVTILEYVSYEDWSRCNYLSSYATLAVRGLLLAAAYYGFLTAQRVPVLAVAVSIAYAASLPPVLIPVERTLFRVARQLERIYGYVKFTSLLPRMLEADLSSSSALELRWETWRDVPSYRPLLAALVLVASSDALFILVPSLLSGYVGKRDTVLVYALSSLASALALALVSRVSAGRLTALASGLSRAALIPAALHLGGVGQAVAFLLAASVLFNVFNTSNYNAYVRSSAGQGTFLYRVMLELGSAAGSAIGGFLASRYGVPHVVAFSVIGHVVASLLAP